MLATLLMTLVIQTLPTASAGKSIAWDYSESDRVSFSVTRFEIQVDNGAWVSIGIPPSTIDNNTPPDSKTYKYRFPVMSAGNHTISVRACTSSNACSSGMSLSFNYIVLIIPNVTGLRIVMLTMVARIIA